VTAAAPEPIHCRCWTESARVHAGHCCMAKAHLWCHQDAGMAALSAHETEGPTAHQETS
jgi:hypothetical protein